MLDAASGCRRSGCIRLVHLVHPCVDEEEDVGELIESAVGWDLHARTLCGSTLLPKWAGPD
eukprot:359884-Chlamydomonas_euryale.AAC.2